MQPRDDEKPKSVEAAEARGEEPKLQRFRIVRLEPRIAPAIEFRVLTNHNETLVRDRAETPRPGR
jgi:hypothetical protein